MQYNGPGARGVGGGGDDDELMIESGMPAQQASASGGKGKAGAAHVPGPAGASAGTDEPTMSLDPTLKPTFQPLSKASAQSARDALDVTRGSLRKVAIPPHRMTPLKSEWSKIYTPLVEMAGLQVRMNVKRKTVEIKVSSGHCVCCLVRESSLLISPPVLFSLQSSKHTPDVSMLQKGADFVKAFALGFEADDAIALLRIDDLFIDSFEIKDVKTLHGDHLSRAIGRIAGKDGRTKFAIENASRTRLVVADTKIHILGSFTNIRIARDAVVSLILGSPPGKVYANLKTIGARQRQRG